LFFFNNLNEFPFFVTLLTIIPKRISINWHQNYLLINLIDGA
jgi:hypothetical protein